MEKMIKEECLNIYMFFKVLKQFNLFNEYLNTLYLCQPHPPKGGRLS